MRLKLQSLLPKQLFQSHKLSSEKPDFNDPSIYFDEDLQHFDCSIGAREIAAVLREIISGKKKVQTVFDSPFSSCISGDLFEFTVDDYSFTLFIDDPGTFDYIDSVVIEGRSAAYSDWKISPELLLSEEEQNQFQALMESL